MNKQTLYIFSLGNPGPKYSKTRHNAGRIVCDEMVSKKLFENIESLCDEVKIKYYEPDTYMNETGKFIKEELRYKSFWKMLKSKIIEDDEDRDKLVIVYDDIDLPLGEVKLSYGRSSGGHNGVESVMSETGTRDFYRIRIGIGGKPHPEMLLQDYVLSKLTDEEIKIIKNSVPKVIDRIMDIVKR